MTLSEAIIHYEEVADRCAVTDGNAKCEIEHRQLAEWIRELQQRRAQSEWIRCSERMPKKTGYYICTCHDGTYYRTSVLKWSTGWTLTGARSYWKVIAWMPLPEPYAERRQDALN